MKVTYSLKMVRISLKNEQFLIPTSHYSCPIVHWVHAIANRKLCPDLGWELSLWEVFHSKRMEETYMLTTNTRVWHSDKKEKLSNKNPDNGIRPLPLQATLIINMENAWNIYIGHKFWSITVLHGETQQQRPWVQQLSSWWPPSPSGSCHQPLCATPSVH